MGIVKRHYQKFTTKPSKHICDLFKSVMSIVPVFRGSIELNSDIRVLAQPRDPAFA